MSRPTYTSDQIKQIYDRIKLPPEYRYTPTEARPIVNIAPGLDLLNALVRHTLANIPFETLSLHYSRTKSVDLHPESLFTKLVSEEGNGRGGYCFENNTFFAIVLRTQGFELYSTCARVHSSFVNTGYEEGHDGKGGFWFAFAHMINIVTIQGVRYIVDVAYGSGGLARPLRLHEGEEMLNIRPSQYLRLRYDRIEANVNQDARMWILERSDSPEKETWVPVYCFADNVEYWPLDFDILNNALSMSRNGGFTNLVLAVKFVLDDNEQEVIGHEVVIGNKFWKREYGKKVTEIELENEAQRVKVLEEELGIRLNEAQKSGILGMATMLR